MTPANGKRAAARRAGGLAIVRATLSCVNGDASTKLEILLEVAAALADQLALDEAELVELARAAHRRQVAPLEELVASLATKSPEKGNSPP